MGITVKCAECGEDLLNCDVNGSFDKDGDMNVTVDVYKCDTCEEANKEQGFEDGYAQGKGEGRDENVENIDQLEAESLEAKGL